MMRVASLNLKIIAVLTSLFSFIALQEANAVQFASTMTSACLVTQGNSSWTLAYAVDIPETATVTRIDWKKPDSGVTPLDSTIEIVRDSSGLPGRTILGTFIFSSISNPISTFTGSAILNGAGRYWLIFKQSTMTGICYTNSTSFTGTPAGWTMGNVFTQTSSDSGATFYSRGDYISYLFTMYGTGGGVIPPTSSLTLSSNSITYFRQNETLTATLNVPGTDGRVTFYINGKKIPGCINKLSSSLTVSCNYKPSFRGSNLVTAKLTPTDSSYMASTSPPLYIKVAKRTSTR